MITSVDRKPGPSLRAALAVLAVGVVLAVPATVILVSRVAGTLSSPSFATPGTVRRHLRPGTWIVFERTGTRRGFGGITINSDNAVELQPSDVTVTAPDGTGVVVEAVSDTQTLTRGTAIYTGALQFHADTSGTYTVEVHGPPVQAIVARSLGESVRGWLGAFAVAAAGGLLVLTGLVLVVVGAVRRGRAHPVPRYTATPPGWYPDPWGQARLRWWDGARWTGDASP